MEVNNTSNIDISKAFKEAWKGFKGWWIPLCIVSSILLFSQSWLPKLVIRNFEEFKIIQEYKKEYDDFSKLIEGKYNSQEAAMRFITKVSEITERPETQKAFQSLFYKMLVFWGVLLVLVSILHVIIIVMSKLSVSSKKESLKANAGKPFTLTPSYLLLGIIKIIPFFFLILPGIILYVKFYFTGFIITEESANPFTAMKKSWKLTEGIFWPTFFIFAFTIIIYLILAPTIIGLIPGTSFIYTLRASLYKQALEQKSSSI